MNYKKVFKRETKVIAYVVIALTLVVIGSSYALFLQVNNNRDNQVVTAGSLVIEYANGNTIEPDENDANNCLIPQGDETGSTTGGCKFTLSITNTGTLPMQYDLLIYNDAIPEGGESIEYENVKHSLNKQLSQEGAEIENISNAKLLSELEIKEEKRVLETNTINVGETITFSLNIWIKEDAPESIVGKYVYLKLDVVGTVFEDEGNGTKATDYITSLASTSEELVYDGTVDNNLRYIGANPKNYVSFNGELWRIIGVMNDVESENETIEPRIKLIRNESLGDFSWDYKQTGVGSSTTDVGSNDWSDSQLMMMLNPTNRIKSDYTINSEGYVTSGEIKLFKTPGSYYNRTNGYQPATATTTAFTETAIDFSSTGLTEESRNMIQAVKWKLGGSSTYDDVTASMFYERERGTTVYSGHATEWTGEIGLMYPSDYGYATSGGSTTNRETCLAKELSNWVNSSGSDCKNNDWLYNTSYQWTLSLYSLLASTVARVNSDGYVYTTGAHISNGVRPVLYLTSDTSIESGEGSLENPYILKRG